MIRLGRHSASAWRRVCLTLAAVALVVKVLVPPGFMPSAQGEGGPFAVVHCPGHAAGEIDPANPADRRSPNDAPCAFAGNGVGAVGPDLLDGGRVELVAYHAATPARPWVDVTPGRGLSAPPLPARGPPDLLI